MFAKRAVLFVLFILAGLVAVPQGASALSFTPSAGSPIAVPPPDDVVSHAAVADFDGNGNDDIALVGASKGIQIYLTDSEGIGFTSVGPIGTETSASSRISVHAGQFGGDSAVDLVSISATYPSTIETYIGNGDGTFPNTPTATYSVPQGPPNYPSTMGPGVTGDVNDDGWDDLVVGMNYHSFTVALGSSTGQFSTGSGSPVQIPIDAASNGAALYPAAIGDWDGDGDKDLAFGLDDSNNSLPGVHTASNDGQPNPTFTGSGEPVLQQGPFEWPSALATVDLDGDSADDLAVATANNSSVKTLLGSGSGLVPNTAPGGTFSDPGYPYALAIADFNKDGLEDVAVANRGDRNVTVLTSGGDGTLTEATGSPFGLPQINGKNFSANTLDSGDFNGDGAPDFTATSSHSGDPNQARGVDVLISRAAPVVSPEFVDFPATAKGAQSEPLAVNVKNDGAPDLVFDSATTTGSDSAQFEVNSADCETPLEAGQDCDILVTFKPTSNVVSDVNLDIAFEGGFNTESIPLNGNTPPYMDFVPPMGLEFGEVTSGYAPDAETQTIVIYSGGGADLELGEPQITGPDASDFEIEDPTACAGPLPFGSNCALDVTFLPPADTGGFREAYMTFATDNDPEENEPIPLTGYAIRAEYSVTPASFDFGEAKIDPTATRTAQTFTLDSTGPAAVPFEELELTGPDAESFKIMSNTCPETIDAYDGTCTFSVVFDPTAGSAGSRNATLQVDAFSSVNPGPTAVALTGTATSDPIPPIGKPKLTLKLKSAGKVKRGKTLVVTATVKNVGDAPAKPLNIKATAPKKFAKTPKAIKVASLAPGKSVTRKLKIKVKKTARKGKKLTVKVTASTGKAKKTVTRTVRVR